MTMQPETALHPTVRAANGFYGLMYQADGNLVLYGQDEDYGWDSKTDNNPGSRLIVQDDGNAVIYRPEGTPVWVTGTP